MLRPLAALAQSLSLASLLAFACSEPVWNAKRAASVPCRHPEPRIPRVSVDYVFAGASNDLVAASKNWGGI